MSGTANHLDTRYASLPKVAAFLGMTPKALRKRVERRTISFRRAGKRLLFNLVELEAWVSELPGVTAEEALGRMENTHNQKH